MEVPVGPDFTSDSTALDIFLKYIIVSVHLPGLSALQLIIQNKMRYQYMQARTMLQIGFKLSLLLDYSVYNEAL